jgi:hypothetical protein
MDRHFMRSAAVRHLGDVRRFSSFDDEGEARFGRKPPQGAPAARDELPFKIELWDNARQSVETLLAIAAHGTIAYAAFYSAAKEYPHRYITLRHDNKILSRWSGGH